jgi:hypothetical protein
MSSWQVGAFLLVVALPYDLASHVLSKDPYAATVVRDSPSAWWRFHDIEEPGNMHDRRYFPKKPTYPQRKKVPRSFTVHEHLLPTIFQNLNGDAGRTHGFEKL